VYPIGRWCQAPVSFARQDEGVVVLTCGLFTIKDDWLFVVAVDFAGVLTVALAAIIIFH
jgi:hypothetical protein